MTERLELDDEGWLVRPVLHDARLVEARHRVDGGLTLTFVSKDGEVRLRFDASCKPVLWSAGSILPSIVAQAVVVSIDDETLKASWLQPWEYEALQATRPMSDWTRTLLLTSHLEGAFGVFLPDDVPLDEEGSPVRFSVSPAEGL